MDSPEIITAEMINDASPPVIADWIETRLAAALDEQEGPVAVTIPGGSTPFPILADLVQRDLDWARLQFWPNDDRIVPEDHEASNTGKMRALLEPVGAAVCALGEDSSPPHFVLTWLGMGPDGHIASLFPNTDPELEDTRHVRRLTPDPLPAHAPFDRITLTLPALLDCDAILFTLGGAGDKRAVFEAAMRGENDLPIARLLCGAAGRGPASMPVTCFT
ncbi:6-phosphogluconolactonase [Erythrobacter sp. MTPC3]|uniref:6-phosphogluconolactonase n=1 Tax=Erythrobacter sp. MTPC3 TaxID=3056564 RepID=UPI0036F30445